MSRKSTPDVLSQRDVMGDITGIGASELVNHTAIKPASNKVEQNGSGVAEDGAIDLKAINQVNNIAVKTVSNKAIKPVDCELKEKATFNLSVSILEDLEDAWIKLKRATKDTRVTKTLIVETALQLVLNDYHDNGDDSGLAKHL